MKPAGDIECVGDSAIVVIPIGNTESTLRLSRYLHSHNIYANGIIPPGVRRGNERVRFNVTLTHSFDDLDVTADRIIQGMHLS